MHAEGLALIGELGLARLRELSWEAAAIGGLTMGADPVAYAIARESDRLPPRLNGFSVRKAAKTHGTGRRIEGCFESGDRVIIVEDVITTGASALEAAQAVQDEGGAVVGILALLDRDEGGRAAIEAAGFRVSALLELRDLVPQ